MNGEIISKIYLDIDVEYWHFTRGNQYIDLLDKLRHVFGLGDARAKVWIRISANGRVHLKIEMQEAITVFHSLMYRAWFGDDASRLAHDLARYYEYADVGNIGRIFDEKLVGSDVKKAGPWETVDL